MKTIQAKPKLMVSDRAYCAIMSDCIKTLMAKGVLPHVFEVTIYVIQKYLESQIAPLNGDMFVMEFFRTFRPGTAPSAARPSPARPPRPVARKSRPKHDNISNSLSRPCRNPNRLPKSNPPLP